MMVTTVICKCMFDMQNKINNFHKLNLAKSGKDYHRPMYLNYLATKDLFYAFKRLNIIVMT